MASWSARFQPGNWSNVFFAEDDIWWSTHGYVFDRQAAELIAIFRQTNHLVFAGVTWYRMGTTPEKQNSLCREPGHQTHVPESLRTGKPYVEVFRLDVGGPGVCKS